MELKYKDMYYNAFYRDWRKYRIDIKYRFYLMKAASFLSKSFFKNDISSLFY